MVLPWQLEQPFSVGETSGCHVKDEVVFISVKANFHNNNELRSLQEVSHMCSKMILLT